MATLPASAISVFHFDNDLNDALGNAISSNSGAVLSTAQSKFGSNSLFFNGTSSTGQYLQIDLPNTNIYTIAMWIYSSNTGAWWATPLSTTPSGSGVRGLYLHVENGSVDSPGIYGFGKNTGGYSWVQGSPASAFPRNQWVHIALMRNGSYHYLYVNGSLAVTLNNSEYPVFSTIYLGALLSAGSMGCYYLGYISELIVASDMLWSANFTPPPDAYVTFDRKRFFFAQQNQILFGGI